jgi:CDP-diacylglycerol--glycerol-3-phosphate 3-phosphatidyltransferase
MSPRTVQIQHEPGLWPPTWPMGLTMLRLVLLPVFLFMVLSDAGTSDHSNRRWAVAIFAVMAATDKLDGMLARKLNQTSKLGAVLDPVADKLLIACSVIALSIPHIAPMGFRIPPLVVIIIYGKDLLVAFGVLALLSLAGKVTITPRPLGKLATVLQLALVIGTLLGPDLALLNKSFASGLVRFLWWSVCIVTLASAGDYLMQGFRQLHASRLAPEEKVQRQGPQMNADSRR